MHVLGCNLVHLDHLHFRGKNEPTLHKFGCRYTSNDVTVDLTIVHPWFSNSDRSLASRSEIVTTICVFREILCGTEEVTLDTVMCLVKVYRIYRDSRLLHTVQGVICGEDDNMFTNGLTHLHEQFDLFRFSCSEMFGLTTVNMKNICVVDVLHVLTAKLFCKKNTRGNDNNSARNFDREPTHCIHDCDQCFATTSGDNHLTDGILMECIKSTLLMGTEGDCHLVWCVYQWGSSEVSNNNHNITAFSARVPGYRCSACLYARRVDSAKTVTVM